MTGKGNITLDDIAKGIAYNKEPYLNGDRFDVLTPDISSQKRFFGIDNYTHKYLAKEKRSPFVEYREKIPPYDMFDVRPTADPRPVTACPETKKISEPSPPPPQQVPPQPLNPGTKTAVPAPRKSKPCSLHSTKTMILPRKVGVYHPRELYTPTSTDMNKLFSQTNPFTDTRYNNMLSALRLGGKKTLAEVLQKANESRATILAMLKRQRDKKFLTTQLLPPVPKSRGEPLIIRTGVNKNTAKRIGNEVHNKMTNGGYTRTSYGGFFMH